MSDHGLRALHDEGSPPTARRRGAAAAAGHTGDLATARRALGDPDPAVRASGLGALVRLGALSVLELSAALRDQAPALRRRAAELSWRSGLAVGEVLPLLLERLSDEDAVAEAACAALGELGDDRASAPLAEVAREHPDPLCRESAVAALGAIGAPASLEAILAALADRPAIRRRAVLALASYEGPEVDSALAGALEDRDWQVRQAAEDLTGSRPT